VARGGRIEAPERLAWLDPLELTRPNVKRAAGDGGIKGMRPQPVLKPPPSMALPIVCWAGSSWDILRSFAPDEDKHAPVSRSGRGLGYQDASMTTGSRIFIPPNGRIKIRSWNRGMLLGSGSFGNVYEGISDEGVFFAVKEVSLSDQGSNAKQCIFQLEQVYFFIFLS